VALVARWCGHQGSHHFDEHAAKREQVCTETSCILQNYFGRYISPGERYWRVSLSFNGRPIRASDSEVNDVDLVCAKAISLGANQ
jgi:hypothetical protein